MVRIFYNSDTCCRRVANIDGVIRAAQDSTGTDAERLALQACRLAYPVKNFFRVPNSVIAPDHR
jgi:hypothetical protein